MTKKALVKTEPKATSPAEMIKAAVTGKADLDKLEKLLVLQERYESNKAKQAFHEAMAAFKTNPPKILKDVKVGYDTSKGKVGYTHTSLHHLVDKVTPALSEHGLSASWAPHQENEKIGVTCVITHVLGHSESFTLYAPPDTSGAKNSIQAIGSTVAYLQRYTLLAALGLAAKDMDDDGRRSEETIEYINDTEQHKIADMVIAVDGNLDKFLKNFMKVDKLEHIFKKDYPKAIAALEAAAKKRGK